MDWFSWLSKTPLDPCLVYEYGLVFSRNELRSEDLSHFNHHFLQSIGISVAKHRLHILHLARKTTAPTTLSGLFNNTRRRLNKYFSFSKWVPPPFKAAPPEEERVAAKPRPKKRVALSGPLSGKVQERLAGHDARSLKLSGPLDGRLFLTTTAKSPKLSGPLDGRALSPMSYNGDFDDRLIWASLFDEIKPT